MLRSPQVTFSLSKFSAVLLLPVLLSSCALHTFIKKAPKNIPYVYKTNIKVEGNLSSGDKQELETKLQNQLDDSLKLKIKSYPLWETISKPPIFDTTAIRRSEVFFVQLLNSLGYFSPTIKDTFFIDTTRKGEQRVTVNFKVNPARGLKFDSVGFALEDFSSLRYLHRIHQEVRGSQQQIDLVPDLDNPKDLFSLLAHRSGGVGRRPAAVLA